MSLRRLLLFTGAALLIAGVIGLFVPVSVSGHNGDSINCGTVVASNLSEAKAADDQSGANIPVIGQIIPHSNYVAHCQSSLSARSAWSIPLAALGVLAIVGAASVGGKAISRPAP